MTVLRQSASETIRAIPHAVAEGVQQDLIHDAQFRQAIVRALARANSGLGIAILSESQAPQIQDLPVQEAYRLGAYGVVGMLLRMDDITAMNAWLADETDAGTASTATFEAITPSGESCGDDATEPLEA